MNKIYNVMKKHSSFIFYLLFLVMALLLSAISVQAQTKAEDLFKKAVYAEEVSGDLSNAISIYEKVLKNYSNNRSIAAKATYRLGLTHEKMGREKAIEYYTLVVSQYADQQDLVSDARRRLNILKANQAPSIVAADVNKGLNSYLKWKKGDVFGSPSPDGKWFSHVHWATGNMKISNMETGAFEEFTTGGSWGDDYRYGDMSIWSPDGSKIAYYWIEGNSTVSLNIYDLNTKENTRLMEVPSRGDKDVIWPCDWSKDGRYIIGVLEQKRDGDKHEDVIAMYDLDQNQVVEVKALPEGMHTNFIAFSPDMKRIFHTLYKDQSQSSIHALDLATKKSWKIVDHPSVNNYPQLMSDNKTLHFYSDRSGINSLWKIELNDNKEPSEATLVSQMGEDVLPVRMIDDQVYYGKRVPLYSIHEAQIDFSNGEMLERPKTINQRYEGLNRNPVYSKDGSKIAYYSERNLIGKSNVVVVQDRKTGKEATYGDELHVHNFFWTPIRFLPGDNEISIRARGNDLNRFTINLATSTSERSKLKGDCWCEIASDGHAYKIKEAGGKSAVVKINIKSGQEEVIYESERFLRIPALSPDEKTLALLATTKEKGETFKFEEILILDLETSNTSSLKDLQEGTYYRTRLVFSADGQNLVTAVSNGKKTNFVIQPINGDPPNPIQNMSFSQDETPWRIAIHPDGKTVGFTKGSSRTELWVMEGIN
jgi:Tol biopolymer transport system component